MSREDPYVRWVSNLFQPISPSNRVGGGVTIGEFVRSMHDYLAHTA